MVLFRRHDLIKARLVSTPDHLPSLKRAVHRRTIAQHLARTQKKALFCRQHALDDAPTAASHAACASAPLMRSNVRAACPLASNRIISELEDCC